MSDKFAGWTRERLFDTPAAAAAVVERGSTLGGDRSFGILIARIEWMERTRRRRREKTEKKLAPAALQVNSPLTQTFRLLGLLNE